MYLIAGLGNPERDYLGTRHNAGFEVVKLLANRHGVKINKAKHRAFIGEGVIAGQRVLLAMPQTFMNLSGESIRALLGFYKLGAESLIVACDDCALPLGSARVREKGSAGGHNGLKNILYQLETDEFLRVRVGIDEKPPGWELADYVLSRFKENETDDIIKGVTTAADAIEDILANGAAAAMNKYNRKSRDTELE